MQNTVGLTAAGPARTFEGWSPRVCRHPEIYSQDSNDKYMLRTCGQVLRRTAGQAPGHRAGRPVQGAVCLEGQGMVDHVVPREREVAKGPVGHQQLGGAVRMSIRVWAYIRFVIPRMGSQQGGCQRSWLSRPGMSSSQGLTYPLRQKVSNSGHPFLRNFHTAMSSFLIPFNSKRSKTPQLLSFPALKPFPGWPSGRLTLQDRRAALGKMDLPCKSAHEYLCLARTKTPHFSIYLPTPVCPWALFLAACNPGPMLTVKLY